MASEARRSPTRRRSPGSTGPDRADSGLRLCDLGAAEHAFGLEPSRLTLGVLEGGQAGRAVPAHSP